MAVLFAFCLGPSLSTSVLQHVAARRPNDSAETKPLWTCSSLLYLGHSLSGVLKVQTVPGPSLGGALRADRPLCCFPGLAAAPPEGQNAVGALRERAHAAARSLLNAMPPWRHSHEGAQAAGAGTQAAVTRTTAFAVTTRTVLSGCCRALHATRGRVLVADECPGTHHARVASRRCRHAPRPAEQALSTWQLTGPHGVLIPWCAGGGSARGQGAHGGNGGRCGARGAQRRLGAPRLRRSSRACSVDAGERHTANARVPRWREEMAGVTDCAAHGEVCARGAATSSFLVEGCSRLGLGCERKSARACQGGFCLTKLGDHHHASFGCLGWNLHEKA